MAYCPSCGAQTADGISFCSSCGATLTGAPATPPAHQAPGASTPSWAMAPPMPARPTQRPVGVTIVAVLGFISAAFLALGGLLFMVGGAWVGSFFAEEWGDGAGGVATAVGAAIGLFLLVFAALAAGVAWGLIHAKVWAWVLTLVFQGLSAAGNLFGLVGGFDAGTLVSLAISGVIIWYFLTPEVRAYFGRG